MELVKIDGISRRSRLCFALYGTTSARKGSFTQRPPRTPRKTKGHKKSGAIAARPITPDKFRPAQAGKKERSIEE
jgi:hypothetical protein